MSAHPAAIQTVLWEVRAALGTEQVEVCALDGTPENEVSTLGECSESLEAPEPESGIWAGYRPTAKLLAVSGVLQGLL